MSTHSTHSLAPATAQHLGLDSTRWLRKDELVRLLALARLLVDPASRTAVKTLAGALKNGRVRLTPSAHAYVESLPSCREFLASPGARVCLALSRELVVSL